MTACGLGIDGGGTATRWALASADGSLLAEGSVAGVHGRVSSKEARAHVECTLAELSAAVLRHGRPTHVVAGISSYGAEQSIDDPFLQTLSAALALAPQSIALCNDILLSYLAALEPGEGYLVYAGTGSMSVYVDAAGGLYRVGGRGILLDDAGGGFWIARQALRAVWRREEESPGAWRHSVMAQRLFDAMGGTDWQATRRYVYERSRGDVGKLALEVAASAEQDESALLVLADAGRQLARLAQVPLQRHGVRPVVTAGGVFALHPLIVESMTLALGDAVPLLSRTLQSHRKAAHLAAQGAQGLGRVRRIHEGESTTTTTTS